MKSMKIISKFHAAFSRSKEIESIKFQQDMYINVNSLTDLSLNWETNIY